MLWKGKLASPLCIPVRTNLNQHRLYNHPLTCAIPKHPLGPPFSICSLKWTRGTTLPKVLMQAMNITLRYLSPDVTLPTCLMALQATTSSVVSQLHWLFHPDCKFCLEETCIFPETLTNFWKQWYHVPVKTCGLSLPLAKFIVMSHEIIMSLFSRSLILLSWISNFHSICYCIVMS
jgi:hypothetical protein